MVSTPGKPRRRPSIILIVVGILLFLFGLRLPAAQFLGVTTAGVITGVERASDSSSDNLDYNYNIHYSFTTAGDRQQNGSYMMLHVYDDADLPEAGTAVTVRYLPVLAFVNYADGQERAGLGTLPILLSGAAVIILGACGHRRQTLK